MLATLLALVEMGRNLYILAATLILFGLISCGMSYVSMSAQPTLAGSGALWKTSGLFLLLGGLIAALLGVMTTLFEQVDRRNEERRRQERGRLRSKP